MLQLSVVIPSFERPVWLARAIRSLLGQEPAPSEVIVVARDTDQPTHAAIARAQAEGHPFPIRKAVVTEPGFLPPVRAGFALASGDVVATLDDDAEATEGWTRGLLRHYADAKVGGVGGRCINMDGDRVAAVPSCSRVGYVNWSGQFIGNMYMRPEFTTPAYVRFLMGGNMSYRREVARNLEFDMLLNDGVGFGYEVDLGLQVGRAGYLVVFDPAVAIRHYSAPRATSGMRKRDDRLAVSSYAHNQLRIALRRLPIPHSVVALARQILVGERRAPGLIPLALGPVSRRAGFVNEVARAALAGRMCALKQLAMRT